MNLLGKNLAAWLVTYEYALNRMNKNVINKNWKKISYTSAPHTDSGSCPGKNVFMKELLG